MYEDVKYSCEDALQVRQCHVGPKPDKVIKFLSTVLDNYSISLMTTIEGEINNQN